MEGYDLPAYPFRALIRQRLVCDHHFLSSSASIAAQDLEAQPASTNHTDDTVSSRETVHFLTGLLLHEDPRYQRSTSTNAFRRTFHALAFTVVHKTDSSRNTFAASNFASAAAGDFVGMGILPASYNDLMHADQRVASEFSQIAIGNTATELRPNGDPWAKKMHLPNVFPAWRVPQHPHEP